METPPLPDIDSGPRNLLAVTWEMADFFSRKHGLPSDKIESILHQYAHWMERNDAYFGACPKCAASGVLINIGRNNWQVCHTCKTRWCSSSGYFRDAEQFTEDTSGIAEYLIVEPLRTDPYSIPAPKEE